MGEHTHDCNCGCNDEEDMKVTLELEDGSPLVCDVLAVYPVGDNDYIALTPEDEDSEDVYFFRLEPIEGNEDESELMELEDDEYDEVVDAFEELLDEDEYEILREED